MAKIIDWLKLKESPIYRHEHGMWPHRQGQRYSSYCTWADDHDHNPVEYLISQIRKETAIEPFTFERRFIAENRPLPSTAEIDAHEWLYRLEFGSLATKPERLPEEWDFHRYRASMLVGLAEEIAGARKKDLSVLDVACHCGVFSLEFAERGFGPVRGVDLRTENIRQAEFLAKTYGVANVEFSTGNARDVGRLEPADIVFCGGLLYHVTFPMELLKDICDVTREFAIIDTLVQKHPFSGFHLVCTKNPDVTIEGEFVYEFMPTYRGMIDALHAVGFQDVYDILGDKASQIPFYKDHNVRSFLAVKNKDGLIKAFREGQGLAPAKGSKTLPGAPRP